MASIITAVLLPKYVLCPEVEFGETLHKMSTAEQCFERKSLRECELLFFKTLAGEVARRASKASDGADPRPTELEMPTKVEWEKLEQQAANLTSALKNNNLATSAKWIRRILDGLIARVADE